MIRIDARGMRCPWPALRAARALRAGPSVEVIADDPAAARELAALAAALGGRMSIHDEETPRFTIDLGSPSTSP